MLPRARPLLVAALVLAGCAPRSASPTRAPSTKIAARKATPPKPAISPPAIAKRPISRHYVNTGDPIPALPAPHDPACRDQRASATRWVDSDPHTPFFVSDDQGIHEARGCCAGWARAGTRWRTIDAYGQVVGHAELAGGEGYDATQCFELSFRMLDGTAGAGLYVSDTGAWKPPAKSARWVPSAAERKSFAAFVSDAARLLADDLPTWARDKPLPLDQRSLYFLVDASVYGHRSIEHYAVAGGRLLVIARLNPKGRWVAAHLDTEYTNADLGVVRAYRPLAVLDVDGNTVPEVIVHTNAGDGWSDRLLSLDENGWIWHMVAESVGGSTA